MIFPHTSITAACVLWYPWIQVQALSTSQMAILILFSFLGLETNSLNWMNGLKSISLGYGGPGKHSQWIGLFCSIVHLEMLESVGIFRVHPEESPFYSNTVFNSMAQFNTCIVEHWEGSKPCAQTTKYRMRSAYICYWSILVGAIHLWYAFPSHHTGGAQQKSVGLSPGAHCSPHFTEICWGTKPFSSMCLCCIYWSLFAVYDIMLTPEQGISRTKEFTAVWIKNLG